MAQESTTNCTEKYWLLMSAYVDGEASQAEETELLAHLAACERCRRQFAALEHMSLQLSAVEPVEPPSTLRSAVLARTTRRRTFVEQFRSALSPQRVGWAAAAIAILAYLALRPGTPTLEIRPTAPATTFAEQPLVSMPDEPLAIEQQRAQPTRIEDDAGGTSEPRTIRRFARLASARTVARPQSALTIASAVRPGHIGSPRMLAVLPFDPMDETSRFKPAAREEEANGTMEEGIGSEEVTEVAKADATPVVTTQPAALMVALREQPILTDENRSRLRISLREDEELPRFDQPAYRASKGDGLTLIRGSF